MDQAATKSVLVVPGETVDPAGLQVLLSGEPATVTVLDELTALFDTLTNSVVHCLVLPERVEDQRGSDIAYGVRELYPELPIILAGGDEQESVDAGEETIRTVAASETAVAAAIRDAVEDDPPSVAGREPSPMETLLLSLFNEMPDHFYAKDDAARHVLMGRGFNEPTDRLGLTDPEVSELADEHGDAAYRDEMDLIEGRSVGIDVEEFLDLDAEYVRTRKVPWYDADGEIRGLVGHTQDITERKRRQHAFRRQHERMVKVALLAAHELRNELQIVQGQLDNDDDTAVADVEDSLWRISSIVDTVVELSAREYKVPEEKPVWLSRLSREVWDTLNTEGSTLDIDGDVRVVADQESASLLLQFLFQNAIDHAGPAVTVTVGTTPAGFYVADDGPGIDVDPPERVFDAGYTTVTGNTGFGLYIAQMVADDNDWTLSVSEPAAGGTRFDIENVDTGT
jgi:signal transduction histidine kinase